MIIRQLVIDQLQICKNFLIQVNLKMITYEHTSRIRLIHSTGTNYANPVHYEYKICQHYDIAP